ncbi:MAG TPA: cupin [Verrucomicrobiae bacterium]|nr:cupin [Verrucomicrobiae bacterium]
MSDSYDPKQFDTSTFSQEPYVRRIEKPWGYELHWVPEGKPYMGKIMHINNGCRQSMQAHDAKQETYLIMKGRAAVLWENDKGELTTTELKPGFGYTTCIGQRHRLIGITDCDILEASTPEMGTTWRLEDDYERPDETPEQRDKERAGQ